MSEARLLSYEELKGWTAPVWLEEYSHRYDGWALIQPRRGEHSPVAVRIVDGEIYRLAVAEWLYNSVVVSMLGAKRCWPWPGARSPSTWRQYWRCWAASFSPPTDNARR